jgi:hypothetical protein
MEPLRESPIRTRIRVSNPWGAPKTSIKSSALPGKAWPATTDARNLKRQEMTA